MYSLRKLVWAAYIVVGSMLALIILFGVRQYALSSQYTGIIEQSERAIFHFSTIRESITESLIDSRWPRLQHTIPDIEKLNSELVRLQENTLIPPEFRLAMVNKVDLAGVIISVRRLISGDAQPDERKKLQDQMRSIADHLLQYDRIIVSQARARILNFQMVIIGAMGLIISLASFSLNKLYGNTVVPLLRISNQLQATGKLSDEILSGSGLSHEVADLVMEIQKIAFNYEQTGVSPESQNTTSQAFLAEMINETTNQLNGIINYAQLMVDDDSRDLSVQDQEMLQKIIDGGVSIANTWHKTS
jgi:signal transduction histidine kinase